MRENCINLKLIEEQKKLPENMKFIANTLLVLSFLAIIEACKDGGFTLLDMGVSPKDLAIEIIQPSLINEVILKLLTDEDKETQKMGIQKANLFPYKVNENVVKRLIEIAKEETKKDPKDRDSLIITTLGNLTIEGSEERSAEKTETKTKTYMQIKKDIVYYLANALEEENKKEDGNNIFYKNKIKGSIRRAFNHISTNPEFLKNDYKILKSLLENNDPGLNDWAKKKIEIYEKLYGLKFFKE